MTKKELMYNIAFLTGELRQTATDRDTWRRLHYSEQNIKLRFFNQMQAAQKELRELQEEGSKVGTGDKQ